MPKSGVIKLQHLSDGKLRQARTLRRNMTPAEKVLWENLRRNQLGVKFRRQQIIQGFIADFYCDSAKLVIEVDGSVHGTPEQKIIDKQRRTVFENRGLREIRFVNSQIESDLENVINMIKSMFPSK